MSVSIDDARLAIEKFNLAIKTVTDKIKAVEDRLNAIGVKTELEYLIHLTGEEIEHTPVNEDKWMTDIEPPYDPHIIVCLGWKAFGKGKENFRISYSELLVEEADVYSKYCVPLVSVNSKVRMKMEAHLNDFLLAAVEKIKEEYEI